MSDILSLTSKFALANLLSGSFWSKYFLIVFNSIILCLTFRRLARSIACIVSLFGVIEESGRINPNTFLGPNALVANETVTAESIPPLIPTTTIRASLFFTSFLIKLVTAEQTCSLEITINNQNSLKQ